MGRPDKREKQQRRAREGVENALARGRVGDAADALLALAPPERAWALPALSQATCAELGRSEGARDPAPLLQWLARVEREPRLLPEGAAGARARWCLLVTALRARQWSRARVLVEALRPELSGSGLLARLEALVASQGEPDPALFLADERERERLGYEEPPLRWVYPCPARVSEIEAACLGCFGNERWSRFREVIDGWLSGHAAADVLREIRLLAVRLSERELMQRAQAGRGALEVARACAIWCVGAGAPAELERTIATCVRVLATALGERVQERQPVDAAETIAAAAVRYAALRELVEAVVLGSRYGGDAIAAAERLLRTLLASHVTLPLILCATEILLAKDDLDPRARELTAPSWLVSAFEQQLALPAELALALRANDRPNAPLLELFHMLPIPLVAKAVDELWEYADEGVRELLARVSAGLLERMQEASASRSKYAAADELALARAILESVGLSFELSDAELRRLLHSPEGQALREQLAPFEQQAARLSAPMQAAWKPLEARVAPYRPAVLDVALRHAQTPAARRKLVDSFWARRPLLYERVEAVHQAVREGLVRAHAELDKALLRGVDVQPADAARALSYAEHKGAPLKLCRTIARALLEAVERHGTPSGDEVLAALRFAKRLVKPRAERKGKSTATKKPTKSRTATAKSKRSADTQKKPAASGGDRRHAEQLTLPVEGSGP